MYVYESAMSCWRFKQLHGRKITKLGAFKFEVTLHLLVQSLLRCTWTYNSSPKSMVQRVFEMIVVICFVFCCCFHPSVSLKYVFSSCLWMKVCVFIWVFVFADLIIKFKDREMWRGMITYATHHGTYIRWISPPPPKKKLIASIFIRKRR